MTAWLMGKQAKELPKGETGCCIEVVGIFLCDSQEISGKIFCGEEGFEVREGICKEMSEKGLQP